MELLEREAEVLRLEDHVSQAVAGRGRVVFVSGEAGVGKTAMIDAFCQRVADRVEVRCYSCDALSTPRPLGPVRELAAAIGLPNDQLLFSSEARDELFRAVLANLGARKAPVVLIGEDAHWADGATLDFLRFLGRRIAGLPILHIIAYRDDELGGRHPLRVILGDLATAPAVYRMPLRPLSEAAVRHLTRGSGRDAGALHRLTGGNPFFLTEVLAAEDAAVPATVGDAVLARASRLSPEARDVLDVAAVLGAPIDLNLLLRIAGPVVNEIDECIARGLLRGIGDDLAFRHELAREAILASITPLRRQMLHARVLDELRQRSETGDDPALLAHHAEAAGNPEAVLAFATSAAVQAAALNSHREAAAQYARALRFAGRLPAADRARLLEGRSVACYLSNQGEQAIIERKQALEIWRRLGDRLNEGEGLRWLSRFYWFEGHGHEAEAAAIAALEALETLTPGPELAMAYSNLAQLRKLSHDLAGTLHWGNRAIALAEQLEDTETLVHALSNVGSARYYAEDQQGYDELVRSLHLALAGGFTYHACRTLTNLAWGGMYTMQLDVAERWLPEAISYATDHDLDNYRLYLLASQATLRARRGQWDAIETETLQVLRQSVVSPVTRIVALTTLGLVRARRGHPEAATTLDEALALSERNGQLMRLGPVHAARAEAALLRDDEQDALAEALNVRDLVFANGNRWLRGEFAWLLWRAGAPDVPAGDLAEPYARQIAGDALGAAVAWRELGCPYEEARALAESDDPAQVHQAVAAFKRLGAQPAITQAIRRLRALGDRDVPAVRRGPRSSTRANPAGLTRREVEVLALVAAGLRNAEIAERLYLSPKTVSHHVTAILAKLRVETRAEAARTAAKLGIAAET